MVVAAEDIARVRRMTAEANPTSGYSDEDIAAAIRRRPLTDRNGEGPWSDDSTAASPTINPAWIPTYDLNHAAADIWAEKAAALAVESYDFSADGGNYQRSQRYQHAMRMAQYYLARRAPVTVTQAPAGGRPALERFQ